MKSSIASILTALLLCCELPAQNAFPVISPSFYYTPGSYSSGPASTSYSAYLSFLFSDYEYAVVGYDRMYIDAQQWKYDQSSYVAGGMKRIGPFFVKMNLARIIGLNEPITTGSAYTDRTTIGNAEVLYIHGLMDFGPSCTYIDVRGIKNVVCRQAGLRFDYFPDPSYLVTLKPLYTSLTDGRSLVALNIDATYYPVRSLSVQLSGSLGRRAYYFDPDLLIVYNQDETQQYLACARSEYGVNESLKVSASFQKAQFKGYSIIYIVFGMKLNIIL